MKRVAQIGTAVGIGYLLGRQRKLRRALATGTAALADRVGGAPGDLLRRITESLAGRPTGGEQRPYRRAQAEEGAEAPETHPRHRLRPDEEGGALARRPGRGTQEEPIG
ncbi:hypothetical protein [Rhizomonospora bruguierae]|uniref:hypothetical protein n=1 Tax=Rhizomonospora bruguierae TaxID=1581705 RepID=UPI001BCE70CB|nr:hypothetical protein [Micromonospora sp. NBRC 107566]